MAKDLLPVELRATREVVGIVAEPEAADADSVAIQANLRSRLEAQVEPCNCDGHGVVESASGVGQVEIGERVFVRKTQHASVVLRVGCTA